jgi:hypothetical protein
VEGPYPLYLVLLSFGAQYTHDWLILDLEFGSGVGSNFGMKTELSEQELELQAAKRVTLR